jgi:SsrA-binding protein
MENNVNIVNRKVKFEYEFLDTYIAGIQLVGTELKPIRNGKVSLVDSFCFFNDGELFLKNTTIQPDGTVYTHEPIRDRKLLLKKRELKRLSRDLKDGLTIVPYRMFINDRGKVKVEVVLGKGKKLHDKRETIKNRDIERQIKKIL